MLMLHLPRGLAQDNPDATHRFMICQSGSITSAEEAQPYIDGFGAYLADKLGWAEGSYQVRFENTTAGGLKSLKEWAPAFASVSLGLYLAAGQELGLKPLVMAKVNGRTSGRFRILVKKGTYGTLEELKGKSLAGTIVDDGAFVSRVVMGGKMNAETFFDLQATRRPLRALRKVARGKKYHAVLVDDMQFESLKGLSLFAKLEVLYESPAVPNLGLVYMAGKTSEAQVRQFARALTTMCADPQGGKLCKTYNIEGFLPVKPGELDDVRRLYEAGN